MSENTQLHTLRYKRLGIFFVTVGMMLTAFPSQNAIAYGTTYNSQSMPLLHAQLAVVDSHGEGGPFVGGEYADVLFSHIGLDSDEYHKGYSVQEVDDYGVRTYVVQKGDTLSEIAEKFDVSSNTIRWENNLKGNTIRVGQELRILPTTGVLHMVRKGDTLSKIAKQYGVSIEDITIYNDIDASHLKPGMKIMVPNGVKREYSASSRSSSATIHPRRAIQSASSPYRHYFIRPAVGRISSPFGPRRRGYHYGIDIAQKGNVSIVAAASGTVIKTVSYCRVGNSRCGGGYGNHIIVRHDNGTLTKYAHLRKLYVKNGQQVVQGQKIGLMGNTGRSTGQHLHFEIQNARTGAKINPNFLR